MIFIPVTVVCGIAATAWRVHSRRKRSELTPDRKRVFEAAMNSELSPEDFAKLSKSFDEQGLKYEGNMLRKRAALSAAPPEIKQARREAYRKALASTNKPQIMKLADAFASQGAVGAAASLRRYASGLIPNMQGYVKPEDVDPTSGQPDSPTPEVGEEAAE
jgi:hypothetical protein